MSPGLAVELLGEGLVGGIVSLAIAWAVRPYTRELLFGLLLAAAGFYVFFAVRAGETPLWLGVEIAGVLGYGFLGYLGLRRSVWWLAAAWALHALWDVGLHLMGPGRRFAPIAYPVVCLSWDLVIAGYLAGITGSRTCEGRSASW